MFHGVPLFQVEDLGHMFADGASPMGVELREGAPVLCLEGVQDGLEDGVRVLGGASIGAAHRVDGTVSGVLQDVADLPQGLVRRVISAVSLAFLGSSCFAVGVPFLELVAPGGEECAELGVLVPCLRCAGVQQAREFLFCGPNVMDEVLECEVQWCSCFAGVALHAACLCRPERGSGECWRIRAAQDGV